MKEKTQKFISRLGAVLMLGMSLFNFGSVIRKQGTENVLKRSKNYRKKEAEQLGSEQQEISQIAEEEAVGAIAQVQQENQETKQDYRDDARSAFRGALRYSAIGIWAISASIFFTSVVFNYPFGWGKGMLSLLPGNPHLAWANVRVADQSYHVGDELTATIKANSAQEEVSFARLIISFDENVLDFKEFSLENSELSSLENWRLRAPGQLEFALKKEGNPVILSDNQLLELTFVVKQRTEFSKISLNQDESKILMIKEGEVLNLLGKVGFDGFKALERNDYRVTCKEIDASKKGATPKLWEPLIKGSLLPGTKTNWETISGDLAFVCGHYRDAIEGQIQLLLSGDQLKSNKIEKVYLMIDQKIQYKGELVDQWNDQGQWFLVYSFDLPLNNQNVVEKPEDFSFEFSDNMKNYAWPAAGTANFVLE